MVGSMVKRSCQCQGINQHPQTSRKQSFSHHDLIDRVVTPRSFVCLQKSMACCIRNARRNANMMTRSIQYRDSLPYRMSSSESRMLSPETIVPLFCSSTKSTP